jgi:hypothetical protein
MSINVLKSNKLLDGGGIVVELDNNGCGSGNVVVALLIIVSVVGADAADVAGGEVSFELAGGFLGFALLDLFLLDGDMPNRKNASVIDGA